MENTHDNLEQETLECLAQKLLAVIPDLVIKRDKDGNFSEVFLGEDVLFFVDPRFGFGCVCCDTQIRAHWSELKLGDSFFVNMPDGTVAFHRFFKYDDENIAQPSPPLIVRDEFCNYWHEEDINSEVPEMLKRFIEGINAKKQERLALDAQIQDATSRRSEPVADGQDPERGR